MKKVIPTVKYPNLTAKYSGKGGSPQNSQKGNTNATISSMKANSYTGKGGAENMPTFTRNLAPGSSGADVTALQQWLINNGYNIPAGATGYYGEQTTAAVSAWQAANGVDTSGGGSGYFGPKSQAVFSGQQQPAGTSGAQTPQEEDSNYSIVRFTSDPNGETFGDQSTYWLVDKTNRTIRPFLNDEAMKKAYGNNYEAAVMSANILPPTAAQTGSLAGYTFLSEVYGISGTSSDAKTVFSPSAVQQHYGKQTSDQASVLATKTLDGFLDIIKKNLSESGLSQKTISDTLNDPVITAGYINALAYGGYSINDIYMDMRQRELAAQGYTGIGGLTIIDPLKTKEEYKSTDDYQSANTRLSSYIPGRIGSLLTADLNSPLSQMPDTFFQVAFPESFDPTTESFRTKMDNVKSVIYDSLLQNISARTESEKAAADASWETAKGDIEKYYGIRMSSTALQAWQDIVALEQKFEASGLSGSGIEEGAIRDEMNQQSLVAERYRTMAKSDKEKQEIENMRQNASPADIKKMNDEDQAAGLPREQWRTVKAGLTPVTPVASIADFIANIRNNPTQYPDAQKMSDTEIKEKLYDPYWDENGNYRSTLYQSQQDQSYKIKYGSQVPTQSYSEYKNTTATAQVNKEISDQQKEMTATDPNAESSVVQTTPKPVQNTQTTQQTATPGIDYTYHYGQETVDQYNERIKNAQRAAGIPIIGETTSGTNNSGSTSSAASAAQNISNTLSTPPKTYTSGGTTPTTTPTSTKYSGVSIIDYLKSVGQDSSFSNRAKLAQQYGIQNYTGSSDQNTQLLGILNK